MKKKTLAALSTFPPLTMNHNILFEKDAVSKLLKGIEIMAEAVGCTMGPNGMTMLISKRSQHLRPIASKDGVTVARHILLEDPEERLGAEIMHEAADRTNMQAGDATTCSIVLAHAMIKEGQKHRAAGRNVNQMRKGMLEASGEVVKELQKMSQEVKDDIEIKDVGTISAQDEKIGQVIADVMMKIGQDSTIAVDIQQASPGISYEVLAGMQFPSGLFSALFSSTNQKPEYKQDNVAILLTDDPIMRQEQLAPMLDEAVRSGAKAIAIFGPHIDASGPGSPMAMLVTNKARGKLFPVFIKVPDHGERLRGHLEDIAVYTGAHLFSSELGNPLPEGMGSRKPDNPEETIEGVRVEALGTANRVIVGIEKTAVTGGGGEPKRIEEHVESLRARAKETKENFEKEFLRERMGRLSTGVGVIRVAAATEFESEELRLRVDDALSSVRSAMEEGVVPGGGVALLRAYEAIKNLKGETDDETLGMDIIRNAIQVPAHKIASVAGARGDAVVEKILEYSGDYGFNAATKEYGSMYDEGIIDPCKAIRCAVENATSVAATILTMFGTITEIPEPEPQK